MFQAHYDGNALPSYGYTNGTGKTIFDEYASSSYGYGPDIASYIHGHALERIFYGYDSNSTSYGGYEFSYGYAAERTSNFHVHALERIFYGYDLKSASYGGYDSFSYGYVPARAS